MFISISSDCYVSCSCIISLLLESIFISLISIINDCISNCYVYFFYEKIFKEKIKIYSLFI